jgi:hypothetical protein
MRLSHARRAVSVRFDDPNLVSCAGLAAAMALAARCGLAALLGDRLHIAAKGGVNATAKVLALVAGMVAGADSISDMDLLRHGAMGRLFTDIRAPSTLGTFQRPCSRGPALRAATVANGALGVTLGAPLVSWRAGRCQLPRAHSSVPVRPGHCFVAGLERRSPVRSTPSPIGRMISTLVPVRPGRTCAGTPSPTQNRRSATAFGGPGPTTTTAEPGRGSGEGGGLQGGSDGCPGADHKGLEDPLTSDDPWCIVAV